MPWAALAAIASIVGTGVSVGSTIYGMENQPSMPQGMQTQGQQPNPWQPQQPQPMSADQNAAQEIQNRARQALQVRQQLPGLQSQTGGSVSPDYLNTLGSQESGVFGANPSSVNPGGFSWLGLSGGAPESGSSGMDWQQLAQGLIG